MVLDNAHITFDKDVQCWRLATQKEDCEDTDKTIFTATGALGVMDLPPILKETL